MSLLTLTLATAEFIRSLSRSPSLLGDAGCTGAVRRLRNSVRNLLKYPIRLHLLNNAICFRSLEPAKRGRLVNSYFARRMPNDRACARGTVQLKFPAKCGICGPIIYILNLLTQEFVVFAVSCSL